MPRFEISGTYRNGKIELVTLPPGVREAEVRVVFLSPGDAKQARADAGKQLLTLLRKGIDLGGPPYPRREDLYDRNARRDPRVG